MLHFLVVQHRKELNKTGGGPPPADPDPLDEMAAAAIGKTALTGIPGGGMEVGGIEKGRYLRHNIFEGSK